MSEASQLSNEDSEDERGYTICPGSNSNCVGVPGFQSRSVWLENFVLFCFLIDLLFLYQEGKVSTTTLPYTGP